MDQQSLLCSYPWTHLFISNSGAQSPCCFSQEHKQGDQRPRIQSTQNIDELWNSEFLKSVRLSLKAGKFPEACGLCKYRESNKLKSPREHSLVRFSEEAKSRMMDMDESGKLRDPVLSVDFRLGNLCNLKCRMCHPSSSRLLIREWEKSGDSKMQASAQAARQREPWSSFEETLELFRSPQVNLQSIHFAGGEPAIEPNHKKLLSWLVETGQSSQLRVSYNTNLTHRLDILDQAHLFKEVVFEGSIDGIGPVNNYIRSPAQWNEVSENLNEIFEFSHRMKNVKVGVNITVQVYNILHIGEIFVYFSRLGIGPEIVPGCNYVYSPSYFKASIITDKLKMLAEERMRNAMERLEYREARMNSLARKQMEEVILFMKSDPHDPKLFAEFFEKTRFFDQQRGEQFEKIFPDFATEDILIENESINK